jgi:hypothetical protein
MRTEGALTMPRMFRVPDGLRAPKRGGRRPRRWLAASAGGVLALGLVALVAACSNGGGADQVDGPLDVAMTNAVQPSYSDGNITLYDVYTAVPLPVRRPTQSDIQALGGPPKGTPYPHSPFLLASDESIEVHFVITNLENTTQNVWLLVDPWNEFVRWKPGVTVVSDEETDPNYGYDTEYSIPPNSRVEGTLLTDDMQEIATKLASVENYLASSTAMQAEEADAGGDNSLDPTEVCNNIFNPQNRSNSDDPVYTPWIPPVIAGLTGFDIGLRVQDEANSDSTAAFDGGSAAPTLALEISVDVQDLSGNRLVAEGSSTTLIGVPPKVLSPPAARF